VTDSLVIDDDDDDGVYRW